MAVEPAVLANSLSLLSLDGVRDNQKEAIASREILAVLNGCQSSYILTSVDEAEDTLRLDPSPGFGFALLALLEPFVPVCQQIWAVRRFCYTHTLAGVSPSFAEELYGCTFTRPAWTNMCSQALASAISTFLFECEQLLVKLTELGRMQQMTLLVVKSSIRVMSEGAAMLSPIVRDIDTHQMSAADTIDLLEQAASRASSSDMQRLASFLLREACAPHLLMLRRWLTAGEVEDKYGEFFVDTDRIERAERRMAEDWMSDAEESGGEEEVDGREEREAAELLRKAPRLFQDFAESALITGRHIRALKGHGYKIQPADSLTNPGPCPSLSLESVEAFTESTSQAIDRQLFGLLMKEFDLKSHLKTVWNCILLAESDFIPIFLRNAAEALEQRVTEMSSVSINNALGAALCSSSQASNPFNERVKVTFDTEAIRAHFLGREEGGEDEDEEAEVPYAGNVLTLIYDVHWPISLILSPSALSTYSHSFTLLFHLYRGRHALDQLWLNLLTVRHMRSHRVGCTTRVFFLHQVMVTAVSHITSHIKNGVLGPSYQRMQDGMASSTTFEQLKALHATFLEVVSTEALLLNQPDIVKALKDISQSAINFCFVCISAFMAPEGYLSSRQEDEERGEEGRPGVERSEVDYLEHVLTSEDFELQVREYEDSFQMYVSAAVALMESAHESLPSLDSLTIALTAVARSVAQRVI